MSTFYRDYDEAHVAAIKLARATSHDVAIRATKEYGKRGAVVRLMAENDSDGVLAERVRPNDPDWTHPIVGRTF